MRSLLKDQRGLAGTYIRIIIVIVMVALTFIILNEFVFRVGDMSAGWSSNPTFSSDKTVLLYIWRVIPITMLFGAIIWGVLMAHRERPTYAYG